MKLPQERRQQIEKETGEPAKCDCCGYASEELGEYRGPITRDHPGGKGLSVFCLLCASTFLSHCITYSGLYGDQHHLFSSIGWIANHLQSEIRRSRRADERADGKFPKF